MSLKISLCGRLAVESDGIPIDEDRLQSRQARLVFAYLVTVQGRPVPREELAEALWPLEPPRTWEKGIGVIVSKLRGLLTECGLDGPKVLRSAFGCYRLDLPDDSWVDVLAAARRAREAQHALDEGDLAGAQSAANDAAALARRRFLPGDNGPWVDERRRELADVLSTALLCLGDASVRAGHPAESVRYAEEVVALEPFRESGYRRLMESHACSGNRAEGLRVYERCRTLLADELGAYPSPETESIYRELLQAAPSEPTEPPRAPPARPRSRLLVARLCLGAGATLAVVAATAVIVFASSARSRAAVVVAPDSVGVIDPATNRVVATVPVGTGPAAVTVGSDGVWVANADDGTVSRIDPATRTVVKTIGIGAPVIDLALRSDAVWVANGTAGTVARLDRRASAVTDTLDVSEPDTLRPRSVYGVAVDGNAVWVAVGLRSVVRLDRETGKPAATIDVGGAPIGIDVGEGATWVATDGERIVRIASATGAVTARVPTPGPVALAVGEGAVWVALNSGTVWRIDPATGAVTDTIPVGKGPRGVTAAGGSVWVANGGDGTVSRIDPHARRASGSATCPPP